MIDSTVETLVLFSRQQGNNDAL